MEYKFSTVVDPSSYDTRGLLCDEFDVRYHKNAELEDIGCLKCQEHWRQSVGPLGAFKGTLGNILNLISLAIPECLPERLSIVAFANELAFMHDDVTDIAEHGDVHNNDFKDAFNKMASTGTMDNAASGKRALPAYIAKEMVRIDNYRAIPTIKAWAKFVDYGGRQEMKTWRLQGL
ncbi:uncharacterized protein DSM5745_00781 [Aspergillus mulundensis]|uniref:Uncharacterized protein n=1 Tax=Aspergillus mulundensis TaxID=1810919 RepID=A0A3D8T4K3_9EURO|nr:hypothetical protein DSM5745_00781 [Aspergillus mulundensis]RDW93459.1 hypothetical protein DSM5745_00781 [Aspergillus mulundensis]